MDRHFRAAIAEVDEGDRVEHPTLDVGLAPNELARLIDLDIHTMARILGTVGVVDHHRVEGATRS